MPNLIKRFQVSPDLRQFAKSSDCPIDAQNIADSLTAAGIQFATVNVDHQTGEVEITYPDTLTAAKKTAITTIVRAMPQYQNDLA